MNRLIRSDAMRWLLWKDYRHNRLILGTAVVLLVVPYSLALLRAAVWILVNGTPAIAPDVWDVWGQSFAVAGIWSLIALQVTLALFGGHAIAGERNDRSAEFLGALPISRGKKLASKLWVALGLLLLVWVPNLAIQCVVWFGHGGVLPNVRMTQLVDVPVCIGVTGLTFFCVAWMFSAMLESTTFSVGAGLATPLLVGIVVTWSEDWLRHRGHGEWVAVQFMYQTYVGVCLLLCIVCFAVGTRYYLRRVEP
jgi:ABC-type transport system involved in multi-copper enzyme maturation permease subunit